MSNAIVIFTFEGVNVKVHCSTDDLMKDICQKFANKIERNVNSLIFLYGGSNLNFQLSFKELANIIDKERNEMNVLVYKNLNEFACPKCGEKINLNTCFCAVYQNTQIAFIKDSVSSFLLGIFLPFILYIFPSIFRIISLKSKSNIEYVYKFSNIIPFF